MVDIIKVMAERVIVDPIKQECIIGLKTNRNVLDRKKPFTESGCHVDDSYAWGSAGECGDA